MRFILTLALLTATVIPKASANPGDAFELDGDRPVIVLYHREASAEAADMKRLAERLDESGDIQFVDRPVPGIDSPHRPQIAAIATELDAVGIAHIPAVIVADLDGKAFATVEQWPSEEADLRPFVEELLSRQATRDDAFERAAHAEAMDNARALHEGLQSVEALWWRGYLDEAQELVRLDQEYGDGSLAAVYLPKLVEIQIDLVIQQQVYPLIDLGRFAEAAERVHALEAALPVSTDQRQMLRAFRAQLLINARQPEMAVTFLQEAIDLSPDSDAADKLRTVLEKMTADTIEPASAD